MNFTLDESITIDGYPSGTIVGIDRYRLKSLSGSAFQWTSFTLTSATPAPFDRWWLVDLPVLGPHAFYRNSFYDASLPLIPELSGLVELDSSGDAMLSDFSGALFTHSKCIGTLSTYEIFPNCDAICFEGKKLDTSG